MLNIKIDKAIPLELCKHLLLLDTGVSKNAFRNESIDYIRIFHDIYYEKYRTVEYNFLSTPNSFMELLGNIAEVIPEDIYRLKTSNSLNLDIRSFLEIEEKVYSYLEKHLTRKVLEKSYYDEIKFSKNKKATNKILKTGRDTFIRTNSNRACLLLRLATNFSLMNEPLIKAIEEKEPNEFSLAPLCHFLLKRNPNQSLAYFPFSFFSKSTIHNKAFKKHINLNNISAAPLKELLDFEAIHFLCRGYCSENPMLTIPVIFVTQESNEKKWHERVSIYRQTLRHLGLNTKPNIQILSLHNDNKKWNWINFTESRKI